MADEKDPFEGTRVDLGEDLLEESTASVRPGVSSRSSSPSSIEDDFESARILVSEGILEEAKRVLRKILVADPDHREARKLLDQVHEVELKQIFGEGSSPRRRLGRREPESLEEIQVDIVLENLDRDLELGLFSDVSTDAMSEFSDRMEKDFADASPSDRIDVGIAFLEMGLYGLAIRHFEAAVRKVAEPELLLSATSLLAYALILARRPFDAVIAMESVLRDSEIETTSKLELIYLMGRAHEAMGKAEIARDWYLRVAEIEPRYRDVERRLKK